MEVLSLGLRYDKKDESELLKFTRTGLGIASNLLQDNLIKGLELQAGINITCLSSVPVGNFPIANKKVFFKSKSPKILNNTRYIEVKTINLPVIKHYIREKEYIYEMKNWMKDTTGTKERIVLIYDLYQPFLKCIHWLKSKHPEIKVVLMIPDLVGKLRNNGVDKYLQSDKKTGKILSLANQADAFLMITEQLKDFIDISNKPYRVINGIIDPNSKKIKVNKHNNNRVVLYSGLLSKQYNVDVLVESFTKINDGTELWICGYGELKEIIKKIANNHSNIIFFGEVAKEKANELETQADILINPRPNNGIYTKYSFPSKNLEYLLAGKPVLCYKLDGIDDRYDDYFEYINPSVSPKSAITEKILEISRKSNSELSEIGEKNRRFVIENNGYENQAHLIQGLFHEVVTNYED